MDYQIRVAEPCLDGNEEQYVLDCLRSSWISSRGKYIEQFEEMVASFCGVRHAVATNNGTTALHLALAAHGLRPGDDVLVPSLSYIASANTIHYCHATPVFVDSCTANMTIDPDALGRALTPRTRGIVTVPLYGHPVDLAPILDFAERHGLFVIEDAAEALGARYRGQPIGSLGDCATFSFFGNKIITTGEGGMVVTDDSKLADRLRLLRGQGVSPTRRYWHIDVGFNYRMTNICAAIGCAQMEQIDLHLNRRREVAGWYFDELSRLRDYLVLPQEASWAHHCYWMFTVQLTRRAVRSRDEVIAVLDEKGIETRPVFYPMHTMPPYEHLPADCPVAEQLAATGISLPTHAKLTQADVKTVCHELATCIAGEYVPTFRPIRSAA